MPSKTFLMFSNSKKMGTLGFYFTNSPSSTMSYKMDSIYALTPRPATPVLLHRSAQLRCPERVRVAPEAVRQVGSAWSERTFLEEGGS